MKTSVAGHSAIARCDACFVRPRALGRLAKKKSAYLEMVRAKKKSVTFVLSAQAGRTDTDTLAVSPSIGTPKVLESSFNHNIRISSHDDDPVTTQIVYDYFKSYSPTKLVVARETASRVHWHVFLICSQSSLLLRQGWQALHPLYKGNKYGMFQLCEDNERTLIYLCKDQKEVLNPQSPGFMYQGIKSEDMETYWKLSHRKGRRVFAQELAEVEAAFLSRKIGHEEYVVSYGKLKASFNQGINYNYIYDRLTMLDWKLRGPNYYVCHHIAESVRNPNLLGRFKERD